MLSRILNLSGPSDLATYKIFSEDKQVSGTLKVIALTVTRKVNKISSARLVLHDGDIAKEDFEASNRQEFTPGREIRIELGYHSTNATIFKGIVVKHGIKAKKNKPSHLVIDLKDAAVKMTLTRRSSIFTNSTDSNMIEDLVSAYGLKKEVGITTIQHKEMVQYNSTDWDFMLARADANAMLVYTYDGTVKAEKPNMAQLPAVSALYGATIIEIEAEIDAESQLPGTSATSWDASAQAMTTENGVMVLPKEHGNLKSDAIAGELKTKDEVLLHAGSIPNAELKKWADAKLQRSKLSKIRGRVKIQGFGEIKPGDLIELGGVGNRFSGAAFVSGVRHEFGGTWETDIEFGLEPGFFARENRDITDVPASGLLPAINGLHIGIVTQIAGDPQNEDRILVKIPSVSEKADGVWARLAGAGSGESKGLFFRPDVKDEVIVGFVNDDPRHAVILGSLHSSAKPVPEDVPLTDDNYLKGLITKKENGMKLMFDDEKNIITLETPKGNKLVINEDEQTITIEDESKNKIEMSADGIIIESAGNLELKAAKDVIVDGANITSTTTGKFSADGTGGAELTSSANVVVKGALVEIN